MIRRECWRTHSSSKQSIFSISQDFSNNLINAYKRVIEQPPYSNGLVMNDIFTTFQSTKMLHGHHIHSKDITYEPLKAYLAPFSRYRGREDLIIEKIA